MVLDLQIGFEDLKAEHPWLTKTFGEFDKNMEDSKRNDRKNPDLTKTEMYISNPKKSTPLFKTVGNVWNPQYTIKTAQMQAANVPPILRIEKIDASVKIDGANISNPQDFENIAKEATKNSYKTVMDALNRSLSGSTNFAHKPLGYLSR